MAHLGNYFIFAATGCTILSLLLYFLVWRGDEGKRYIARLLYKFATAFATLAIATLLYLIITHDFTVAYVHSYSSTDLPLGYLIATLWGGQQGTFLLWLFYTSVMGLVMIYTAKKFEPGNMMFLNLFNLSLLAILLKKSPFELMTVFQVEGAGLNPLLQNFWMQIHPPIMFIGFSAIVFPFCFAMTALIDKKYSVWAESARKWTLFAWVTLGTALIMGGYWAYETLGWGGFWAWDPVENSSLIPWIFLTAQVHSLFIKRQRRGLLRFSLFVVCLSFWSVLYGTFLTRSGVLADFSVHSFVDLGINAFLVVGLLMFVGISTFLLIWRWRDIKTETSYSSVNSRSYLVTIGVIIVFLGGVLTLLGTSTPLLTRFTDNPSNVGIEYYFATMTPIAVALLFLIALFPCFKWNKGMYRKWLLISGSSAGLLTVLILLITGFTREIIYLLLFGAATWAFVSNSTVVIGGLLNKKFAPGYLAHVGLSIALTGAAASAGFDNTMNVTLPMGETVSAMGYDMTFTHMVETDKGFDCHVDIVSEGEHFVAVLPHEFPKNSEGVMRKPHVKNYLSHDLYVAPVAMNNTEQQDPGTLNFGSGESRWLDKYKVTFLKFEFDEPEAITPKSVASVLSIEYGGRTEEIRPSLDLTGEKIRSNEVSFDNGSASVKIAGINPEDGSVVLKFKADFLPDIPKQATALIIDISEKPLIILFWVGSFLVFLAGSLAIVDRKKLMKTISVSMSRSDMKTQPAQEAAA